MPRLVATLGVVVYHSSILLADKMGATQPYYFLKFLYSGVDYLFVLSGFLLFYLYHQNFGVTTTAVVFIKKRVLRIYPLYWLVTLAIIPAFFLFPHLGAGYERDVSVIGKSLLLFPQQYPILSIGWTLTYQVYFYLIFTLLFFDRTRFIFYLIMILSLANLALPLPEFFFNHFNLEFFLGMMAAYGYQHFKRASSSYLLIDGSLLLITGAIVDINFNRWLIDEKRVLVYGISAFFLLWGLSSQTEIKMGKLAKPFQLLSKAGYSIYLTHYPIMAFLFTVWLFFPSLMIVKWIVTLFSAIFLGVMVHLVVERRLNKLLRLPRLTIAKNKLTN